MQQQAAKTMPTTVVGRIDLALARRVARRIAQQFKPQKIVLFGSVAAGNARPAGDLDLLIVMESSLPRHKRAVPIRLSFSPAPCPMDLLVFTPEEIERWQGVPNHIIAEALNTGRVLYERA